MEHLADKIQEYIEGQLRGDDLAEFEKQLHQDKDFKNLVNLHREVHEILNRRLVSNEGDLRNSLLHAESVIRNPQKSLYQKLKPFMFIASAACVLLVGYLFLFSPKSDLYELPSMQTEVVRGQQSNLQYEEAVELFNKKSYTASRVILTRLIEMEPNVVQYQYYAALTYIGEQNWLKGVEKLKPIANGPSIFSDEAKYYLAVGLEKQGQKTEAITVLQSIPSEGNIGEKAARLLKKLN